MGTPVVRQYRRVLNRLVHLMEPILEDSRRCETVLFSDKVGLVNMAVNGPSTAASPVLPQVVACKYISERLREEIALCWILVEYGDDGGAAAAAAAAATAAHDGGDVSDLVRALEHEWAGLAADAPRTVAPEPGSYRAVASSASRAPADRRPDAITATVFAIGGDQGGERQVDRYDAGKRLWARVADTRHKHDYSAAAVVQQRLIVAGGNRGSERLVEMYNEEADSWCMLPRLNKKRWGHGMVSVSDRWLYVIAGRGLTCVERLDMTAVLKEEEAAAATAAAQEAQEALERAKGFAEAAGNERAGGIASRALGNDRSRRQGDGVEAAAAAAAAAAAERGGRGGGGGGGGGEEQQQPTSECGRRRGRCARGRCKVHRAKVV